MMATSDPKSFLVVIAGPTGVGKTALSVRLAQQFHTEIISADSRQCFREMNIGTAKPSPEELAAVKHYFINSHSVSEKITAFDFEQYATKVLTKVFQKSKFAVLCGGTGLYIQALCEGLDEMPETDENIFHEIELEFKAKGLAWLQEAIATEDPVFYENTERQNPHRLMRALAFWRTNGNSITFFKTGTKKTRPFQIIKIALELPRPELYKRINHRVDKMIESGLEAEVRGLIPFQKLKNLNTVGYSELFSFFREEVTFSEAVDKIKQHSRNYAKRQMTWFKKDKDFQWFSPSDFEGIMNYVQSRMR